MNRLRYLPIAFACSAIAVTSISLAFQQSNGRDTLADLDPGWVDSWQFEIDKQVDMFAAAYAMNDDQAATFRAELESRLLIQKSYEDKMNAELQEIQKEIESTGVQPEDEESPLIKKLNQRFVDLTAGMPLSESQTAAWIESRMPPEVAREGHSRFIELQDKRLRDQVVGSFDSDLVASKKADLSKDSIGMTAAVDVEHNRPVPTGDLGDRVEAMDRLNRVARNIEPTRGRRESTVQHDAVPAIVPPPVSPQPQQPVLAENANPMTPKAGPPRPVVATPHTPAAATPKPAAKPEPPPQPAPPLDEWEKYVLTTAGKYGFDDTQLTNARSILSDLRRRAYQYQSSRADDFARVELMTDAKARDAEKKALSKPLDALFAELKARLENLPTQAQRQKAGATPPTRGAKR